MPKMLSQQYVLQQCVRSMARVQNACAEEVREVESVCGARGNTTWSEFVHRNECACRRILPNALYLCDAQHECQHLSPNEPTIATARPNRIESPPESPPAYTTVTAARASRKCREQCPSHEVCVGRERRACTGPMVKAPSFSSSLSHPWSIWRACEARSACACSTRADVCVRSLSSVPQLGRQVRVQRGMRSGRCGGALPLERVG